MVRITDTARKKYETLTSRKDVTNHHAIFWGPAVFLVIVLMLAV